MLRSIFIAVLLVVSSAAAARQTDQQGQLERISVRPLDPLLIDSDRFVNGALPDSLTESQFLARLARLYEYQSEVLAATARGQDDDISQLLESALTDLTDLMSHEYVREEPRFMEVYRVLLSEYERHFGVSDTLFVAFGDIFEIRTEVFSELETVRNPLLEDVLSRDLQPVRTTVPMTMNRLVESTMRTLLKTPERHLNHWLGRAETYFPMIEKVFREEGIPDELKYLAMIESGLNPKARSWASAVGMWQFVAGTARGYGLEINSWVDERMDPEKSTRAAAKHLKDLYDRYGDWHIAMAGYNCSPRCIKRAIRRAKSAGHANPNYWDMYRYLPRETRGYIPMFIATSFITSNPTAFNITPAEPGPVYEYHLVPVKGMLSLRDIADMAGSDLSTLKALNPSLRRSTLPPSTGAFYIRIPVGTMDSFTAAYDALPASAKQPAGEYVVRRGDTLSEIGARFGVSVSRLMQKNSLRSTRIQIGQRLVVPLNDYSQSLPDAALADASGVLVQYGRRSMRPILSERTYAEATRAETEPKKTPIVRTSASAEYRQETIQKDAAGKNRTIYTVRRGDTLAKIGSRFSVTVQQLQSWNNLPSTRIISGKRLTIYTDADPVVAPAAGETTTYTVRSGDTLTAIANTHNVTVSQLRRWNGISGSRIRVGQRLSMRTGTGSDVVTHTVRSGDTLIGIAGRYAVTVAKIKSWNNLRSNIIRIGQQLDIFR